MSIRSKVCDFVRRQLTEAKRNRACTLRMYAACVCGALTGCFLSGGGIAGTMIGALLLAFVVAVVFTGKEELDKIQ